MEVKSKSDALAVNELVLVDAQRGSIILNFNQIDTAWKTGDTNPSLLQQGEVTPTPTPIVPTATPESDVDQTELQASATPTTVPQTEDTFGPSSVGPFSPTIYYVDIATGNDSNSCTSTAAPCQHIQETIDKAGAGDMIYISEGQYNGKLDITKSINLIGGWNSSFTTQTGFSILVGTGTTLFLVQIKKNTVIERLVIQNGQGGINISDGTTCPNPITVAIRQSSIIGMTVSGAIVNCGTTSLINSTISNNVGSLGAIYNFTGTLTILNSTITKNSINLLTYFYCRSINDPISSCTSC
jgi:hypothetical protein